MYKHVQLDVYSSVKLMHKHYLKLFILKYFNICLGYKDKQDILKILLYLSYRSMIFDTYYKNVLTHLCCPVIKMKVGTDIYL